MERICILLALLLALTACGGDLPDAGGEPRPPAGDAVSFTDDLGQDFRLETPQRVAAMIGSFADIWCLAGGKGSLIAAAGDAWTSFDLGLGEDVADLGAVKEPNLEVLLAAEPDLILASVNTAADLELRDTFAQAGIPAAYFEVDGFGDYLRMLEVCTRLTGCTGNYRTYGADIQEQVDAAVRRQDGSAPRVLYIRAAGSGCKAKGSEGSVLGEMLADLGCVNIADSAAGLLENLSLEVIVDQDPAFIFAVVQGSDPSKAEALLDATLLSHPAWASLTAVREGRFHVMDQRLYNLKPNADWGIAYEQLADILYP